MLEIWNNQLCEKCIVFEVLNSFFIYLKNEDSESFFFFFWYGVEGGEYNAI